jgi:hypothetical protein
MMQPPPVVMERPSVPTAQIRVSPDSVTVGQPFVLTVSTEAAPQVIVRFPAAPDSVASVALRAPASIPSEGSRMPNGRALWRASYPLAAWDVGTLSIPLGPVTVGNRTVPVFAQIVVRSVLPGDSAQRVPQPPRGPVAWPTAWWIPWLLAVAVAALIAVLLSVAARLRLRRGTPTPRAIERARREHAALDAGRWLSAGEVVHAVDGSLALLLRYLRARWSETALLDGTTLDVGLTTSEVMERLADVGWPKHAQLRTVLETADHARFSPEPLSERDARVVVDMVLPLVEEMEAALLAREAAAEPQRARAA